LKLTIALDRYDRHFPFFDGTVKPPVGIELQVLQVGQSAPLRDGKERHERMLHQQEFDICEFSMSTYLMARSRDLPITAIPVFPRRLFSQSQMWVHSDSGLWHPQDLPGKKVALSSFQTTLSLLAKGDLKFHYGVPWESIHWLLTTKEKVGFTPKPGVRLDFIGKGHDLGLMLAQGEIDAFFLPHPPASVMDGSSAARRLFADCRSEEQAYYASHGDFPIMHVIAVRQALLEDNPWIARAVMDMFSQASEISKGYYKDPNWSRLAWGRHYYEAERAGFDGNDPWQNGFRRNRANLERFIKYSHDQGLIETSISPESLFFADTLDT